MRITHNARHQEQGRRAWWNQKLSLKRNNLQEYFEINKKADDELLSKQPTIQSQINATTDSGLREVTALMQSHFPGCTDVLDAPNDLMTPWKII